MTPVVRACILGGLLLLTPAASRTEAAGPAPSAVQDASRPPAQRKDPSACQALIDRQVQVARDGDREAAEQGLLAAAAQCPDAAAAWRELAGLRFLQSDYAGATKHATRAVQLSPDDVQAWKILATSRFLQNDLGGALAAWNRTGEPRPYAVQFHGLSRIGGSVIESVANLDPSEPLTRAQLERAARRIEAVPGVSDARVVYLPSETGPATVNVHVTERSRVPRGLVGWGTVGGRGVLSDEVRLDIANLTSHGEVWSTAYRWSRPRTRFLGRLELPISKVRGIVAIEGLVEKQTYRPVAASPALAGTEFEGTDLVQLRRRIGMSVTDWATGWWRWMGGAAFDTIGGREYLGFDAGIDLRAARDHVSVIVATGYWTPFNDGDPFSSALTALAWRSSTADTPISFYGDIGMSMASSRAPLAIWPGSHTSAERGGSLRAHPLRDSDVIGGDVFGRRVFFGTVTSEQLLKALAFGRLSVAEFIDTGRAWQRMPGLPTSPFHVDIGIGLRVAGSKAGGTVRLDYARGLRDGRNHVSAGYVKAWPGR